jgi:hypothetical protein
MAAFLQSEIAQREQEIKKKIGEMFESEGGFILEDQDGDVVEVIVPDVTLGEVEILETTNAGGAYVPTVFVGMCATLGMSMPSQHFVHAQDHTVTPETEPPRRGGTTANRPGA